MYLVINKRVTAVKFSNFSGHYFRNRSSLDIGVLGISVYFNIRNTLPKSGTFLLGHPVCIPYNVIPHSKRRFFTFHGVDDRGLIFGIYNKYLSVLDGGMLLTYL